MLFGAYERDAAILLTEEYGWMKKYLHSLEEVDAKSDFFRFPLEDEFLLCECDDLSKEEKVFPILFLLRNLIELVIFNGYWSVVVVRCRQIEALLYRSLTQKKESKRMENRKVNTPVALRKMIGGTMYCVRVHFNEDAKETMKDKIKRMLENDVKIS